MWQVSAHMLPSHSHIELYDYKIVLHFVREDVCAHECLSLHTKSFSCMLWLPFHLSFICYKNTVLFFNIQVQLSTIKEPYYFPHEASPQTLLGCQLRCRLVPEICVNERKDEQVKEQRSKIQQFGVPWIFFPLNACNCMTEKHKENAPSQPDTTTLEISKLLDTTKSSFCSKHLYR